jgi:hypothetical protein
MNTNLNHGFAGFAKTILIVFMVCLTVFIATTPSVLAQEGGENAVLFDPIPDGPGFIMVNPFDFRPYSSTTPWAFGAMPYLYNPSTTEDAVLEAGLTLPHGATITKVTLYFEDQSATNMSLFLNMSASDGYVTRIATIETAGSAVGYQSLSAPTNTNHNVVDNRISSYFLELLLPANSSQLLLVNVRIDYAYTSDLPLVIK